MDHDTLAAEVRRAQKRIAELQAARRRHQETQRQAEREADELRRPPTGPTSDHMAGLRQLEAERWDERRVDAGKRLERIDAELVQQEFELAVATEHLQEARRATELAHVERLSRDVALKQRLFSEKLAPAEFAALPSVAVVLLVSADPHSRSRLALDEEIREITRRFRAARYRDQIRLVPALASQAQDLLEELNEHDPRVVHFSGHGDPGGSLVFVAEGGGEHPVKAAAVARAIATHTHTVRVVVFNACHSDLLAKEAAKHVDVAIGMNAEIDDEAARHFSGGFYGALAYGHSVSRAFDKGLAAIELADIPDADVPVLVPREGVDPDRIVLVAPREDAG